VQNLALEHLKMAECEHEKRNYLHISLIDLSNSLLKFCVSYNVKKE
jgi:hypothetical protein